MEVIDKVEAILTENFETRDNDKLLVIIFFNRYFGWFTTDIVLNTNVSFESITRARRKLQENPIYWGSKKVMKFRRVMQKYYAEYYGR